MPQSNPLLLPYNLPPFSAIQAGHLVPAITQIITECRSATALIVASQTAFPTWDDLVLAVDDLDARLDGFVQIVKLLDSVPQGLAWYQASLHSKDLAIQYKAELAANRDLYLTVLNNADSVAYLIAQLGRRKEIPVSPTSDSP